MTIEKLAQVFGVQVADVISEAGEQGLPLQTAVVDPELGQLQDGRKLAEATPEELRYQSRPKKNKPKSGKTKSTAAEQYLEALEKAQLKRLSQELNLIQLPEEDEEEGQ